MYRTSNQPLSVNGLPQDHHLSGRDVWSAVFRVVGEKE